MFGLALYGWTWPQRRTSFIAALFFSLRKPEAWEHGLGKRSPSTLLGVCPPSSRPGLELLVQPLTKKPVRRRGSCIFPIGGDTFISCIDIPGDLESHKEDEKIRDR